jgi:glycosyltransferase involved in cell wall biosynthesis
MTQRVAYVVEEYPELSQTFVETELREQRRSGVGVDVLALGPGPAAGLAEPRFEPSYPAAGAARVAAFARAALVSPSVLRAGDWPSDGRRLRGIARIAGWLPAARAAGHLHAHFASEAADIAELLGRLAGRPHSFTGHSTDLFADPAALGRRVAAASFAAVVCEYDRREVEKLAQGGRVEVVPVGLDLEALKRTTPYDPDGPVVAVGRLVEQKGFEDLAAIAGEIDRDVVIAGDGPVRLEGVTLAGALDPAASLRLIESASVLVAPSVVARDGSRDGIPTVLKEALALGVPVVASDAVGNPEVVDPAHGALHAAGDRRALADALRGVLARSDREAMGRAGRAWAERHADVRVTAARLRELWAGQAAAE